MENENPWEKKNSPSVDQVLEDLKKLLEVEEERNLPKKMVLKNNLFLLILMFANYFCL